MARRRGRVAASLVALAVGLLVPVAASAAAPDHTAVRAAQQSYEEAKRAYQRGDMEAAIGHLQAAIKAVPDPIYVYNLARAQETAGRLGEAYTSLLRARAMPTISDDLAQLAAAGVERLAPLRHRTVLDVSGFPDGSLVQVDGDLVSDPSVPQAREPRLHQVCALSRSGERMTCYRREFGAGLRVSLPPEGGLRSTLTWPATLGATRLTLGGHRLLLPVDRVTEVEVDSGRTAVILGTADGVAFEGDVELLPGATQAVGPGSGFEGVSGEVGDTGGPGIAPWIVGGVGVVALGTGAALWGISSGAGSAPATTEVGGLQVSRGQTQAARRDEFDQAKTQELAGVVLVGVGAAALVGGAVWLLVGSGGGETRGEVDTVSVSAAPWLSAEAAGAAVMGRF